MDWILTRERFDAFLETRAEAGNEQEVDLIVMPTAGRLGILDALRGSITERMLRQAPCPVLDVPAD
jgi:nucleotide-binding universal stress UspA family protein